MLGYRRVSSWMKKCSPSYGQNHQLVHWWMLVHSSPSQGHCRQFSPHWDSLVLFVKKVFAKIPFLDRLDTPPAQMLFNWFTIQLQESPDTYLQFLPCVADWWNTDPAWIWSVPQCHTSATWLVSFDDVSEKKYLDRLSIIQVLHLLFLSGIFKTVSTLLLAKARFEFSPGLLDCQMQAFSQSGVFSFYCRTSWVNIITSHELLLQLILRIILHSDTTFYTTAINNKKIIP